MGSPVEPRAMSIGKHLDGQSYPDAAHRPSRRDLPSLDGLRALSIACVIIGHWSEGRTSPGVEAILLRLADFGVLVFFTISGYLITTLLWREARKRGAVDLRRFYLRRTLRIFPPYYVYIATVILGSTFGFIALPHNARVWPALAYATNFFSTNTKLLVHAWSLSLEEQFYVTWPFALAAYVRSSAKRRIELGVALTPLIALLAFPIFLRVVIFAVTWNGGLTGQFIFDYFAAGSVLALFETASHGSRGRDVLAGILRSRYTPLALIFAMALQFGFTGTVRWQFAANMMLFTPARAILLAFFIVWAVRNPEHPIGRVLNCRPLRIIGVGSYSLYLWQQMFFGPGASFTSSWNLEERLLGAGICAVGSYFLVERPSLRLRGKIEQRAFAR